MILLCPPEKSTHFHYPLDPKKIRAEGSMHKDTTYQGSDRQDFYRHGRKKKLKKRKKRKRTNPTHFPTGNAIGHPVKRKKKKTNKQNADLDWVCHRQPSKKQVTFSKRNEKGDGDENVKTFHPFNDRSSLGFQSLPDRSRKSVTNEIFQELCNITSILLV